MPKRTDLKKILIIGSGPIVIGQAAEFDFSGSQAALALREEGYETILVNSNPATIQSDPSMADRVYLEPLTVETLERILEEERPDGILAGMGGQTALNLASDLAERGILERFGCELLGTSRESIQKAEDRELFKKTMESIGEKCPKAEVAHSIEEALRIVRDLHQSTYPILIRPAYTLGGTGGGVAHNEEELREIVARGLALSRIRQVLVEESVLGWKEFEYEVMRDSHDNCITICSMENIDPMGIHTGESIVVAPAQTLSDDDHQRLRSSAIRIIRALKIVGGCNIQFAVHPQTGEVRVIEVNPRVSRSSALASKATGYPIARVSAKVAVGMTLDEIPNSATGTTPASFEPALDYIITKIPRWPFDKFRTVDRRIGTQMKSTGEVMAIGRTFEESFLKAIRSLEIDRWALETPPHPSGKDSWSDEEIARELEEPTDRRIFLVAEAFRKGWNLERVQEKTSIDPWFLHKIQRLVEFEKEWRERGAELRGALSEAAQGKFPERRGELFELLSRAKSLGFPDGWLGEAWGLTELDVILARRTLGIRPKYGMVDTCAAEFRASTPYFYSTYEPSLPGEEDESPPSERKKIAIVGGGPIRIGQGIEFDYCVVHAVEELRSRGFEVLVLNNNPETVSTDARISDRLYFEPLNLEDVVEVLERENPEGIVLQLGGQTPLNLAVPLQRYLSLRPALSTRILGTPVDSMDLAEDRERFSRLVEELKIPQPPSGTGRSIEEVREVARSLGFPVLVRPSYVLGGRGMEIIHDEEELMDYVREAVRVSRKHPILVDKYLSHAIEVDVDCVVDREGEVLIGGIQEHVEEAGVHSGDATAVLPPPTLPPDVQGTIRLYSKKLAQALGVVGLVNFQFAVKERVVYILEANPRASRTVPFVSKALGIPLARIAARVLAGETLREIGVREPTIRHFAVKAPVFPFLKLPGVDTILGPEMKSTGEVMGIDRSFPLAFWKAMEGAGWRLPREGNVFVTVRDEDKPKILSLAARLHELGFRILATRGTAGYLRDFGIPCETVWRIREGRSPDAIDLMRRGEIHLIFNTPTEGRGARRDGYMMRRVAVELQIPFMTTIAAMAATVEAIAAIRSGAPQIRPLTSYHSS